MLDTTITSQDRNQCFTVDSVYTTIVDGRPAGWHHRVMDGVTSQRLTDHADEAAAQRECDARNADHCHSLATGYSVYALGGLPTGRAWRVVDTRRRNGFETTTALAQQMLTEADARMVADWANRTQPGWHVGTAEALELAREYFAAR
jgi:hypothetical protein